MKKPFTFCILFLSIILANLEVCSQVNTESMRRDFKSQGFFNQINFDFGLNSGNTNYSTIRTGLRSDFISTSNHVFGVLSYAYSEDEVRKKENKGFIHLRYIKDLSTYISLEAFGQKEFNEFIRLEDRNLLGAGGRSKFIDLSGDSSISSSLTVYAGIGLMVENEMIKDEAVGSSTRMRMTNYLTIAGKLNEYFSLNIVGYYQPKLSAFEDFRFLSEGNMIVKITKYLSMKTSLRLRYDSQPPENVKSLDLNILNGLQIDF